MSALARTSDGNDVIVPHAQVPLAPVQRVQGQYSTAIQVQRPRDITKVRNDAAIVGGLMGKACFYAWGAGDNRVEGITVKLAEELARIWGNCALDMQPVQESHDAWIFTASFIDLETGYTMSRQFRQSKRWKVHGNFDQERKDDIRFQIGQSKALRNVILNCIPEYVVRAAIDSAKGNLRGKLEEAIKKNGRDPVIARMLESLKRLGVDEARLLSAFSYTKTAAFTIDDLVVIRANIDAIEEGSASVDECFPPTQSEKAEATESKTNAIAGRLGGENGAPPGKGSASPSAGEPNGPAPAGDADVGPAPGDPNADQPGPTASGSATSQMSGQDFMQSMADQEPPKQPTSQERLAAARKRHGK